MKYRRYLYFAVFCSGMTTLAMELSASRLLDPFFGNSNLVWATIIGLILIYLTVGYSLGGRWADRSPYPRTMYSVLAWGAFTGGLVPLVSRPVLRLVSDAFAQFQFGALAASFVAVLVLFCIPVTLLGTISPFAIRLAIENMGQAGSVAGRLYAISTLGSFIGTFLPVLLLIPSIGTTATFMVFSLLLVLVALVGLLINAGWRPVLAWSWMPLVLVVLYLVVGRSPIKNSAGQIFEMESSYNYIQVIDENGYRLLRLNEGIGIHSEWHPTELNYYGPWEQFLPGPLFNPAPYPLSNVKSVAIVGLAAGTVARQVTAVYGPVPIDGFEIDPAIIEVGRRFFDMNEPNLNAQAVDGRFGLEHSTRQYSLIIVDAYRPPYIPWHLTTQEFFETARSRLTPDGVVAINVGRAPNDRRLIDGMASTLQAVFPSVYAMDVPDTFNSILYATRQPTNIINLAANYDLLQKTGGVHPLLIEAMQKSIVYMKPTPAKGRAYTDDWAPIELMTNSMVLKYVLFGDMNDAR